MSLLTDLDDLLIFSLIFDYIFYMLNSYFLTSLCSFLKTFSSSIILFVSLFKINLLYKIKLIIKLILRSYLNIFSFQFLVLTVNTT